MKRLMNNMINSLLQAVISNFVAERDKLNSDIIRCLERASTETEFNAVDFMIKKVNELSIIEKNIETTQNLYNRLALKSMTQELTSELKKSEEPDKTKENGNIT